MRDRLEAVSDYYGAQPDNLFILTDVPQLYVETEQGDLAFVDAWQRMVAEDIVPPTVDVLILDTLHNASTGANENSAQDAGIILASLRNLRDALGCACVLCHHANKTGASERGSTSLRASMDTVLKTTKDRDTFTMTCDKLKDGETWPAQQFSLACKAESVRVFWEGNVAPSRTSAKTRERRVLDCLENHPQNRYTADEVARLTNDDSPKSVQNMLTELRKAGAVQAVKEKRKAKDGKERYVWVYWCDIV